MARVILHRDFMGGDASGNKGVFSEEKEMEEGRPRIEPGTWVKPVFLFSDYREFLRDFVDVNHEVRGLRSRLAEAAQCQPSYLTHILQEEAQLSLDQLHGISCFFNHNEPEWEYLRELWLLSRAMTPSLKKSCEKRIAKLRSKYGGVVGARESSDEVADPAKFQLFGTSWHHGALYVALEVKALQTADALAKRFQVPILRVREVLADLAQMGLAVENRGTWTMTSRNFVMDRQSTIFQLYRTAWYMKGMQSFFDNHRNGYHAGLSFAVDRERLAKVQERAKDFLNSFFREDDVSEPKDTVAYVGLDLFEV